MSVLNVNNKRPFIIGLTGGIATGKSTVSNKFKKANIQVVDSDEIVDKLWRTDREMNDIVSKELKIPFPIDRRKLAHMIFSDDNLKLKLNSIVHPRVFREIDKFVKDNMHLDIIVIDMPLLFEVDYDKVDLKVLVYATKDQQVERLAKRDKLTQFEIDKRLKSQMNINQKLFMADYVIYNNNSFESLDEEINTFIEKLGV